MAPRTEALLRKVVAQIREGKLNKARPVLVDLLRREPNNAQAWYLLSFVLEDPQRQQYAVMQAVKIYPDFERANVRLAKLRGGTSDASISAFLPPEKPKAPSDTAPVEVSPMDQFRSVPTFFDETSETAEVSTDSEVSMETGSPDSKPSGRSLMRAFFIVVIFLVLAVLAFFVATSVFSVGINPTTTPTTLATRTLPATWTPTVEPSATATTAPTQTSSPTPEPTGTLTGSETVVP